MFVSNKLRLVAASAIAMLALGGAVASASAATVHLVVAGVTAKSGESFAVTGSKTPETNAELKVEGGPIVKCTIAAGTGELTQSTSLFGKAVVIKFTTCKVTNSKTTEENCEVKEVVAKGKSKELESTSEATLIQNIEPAEPFSKVTIKSVTGKTCSLAASEQEVVGQQVITLPKSTEEKTSHELVAAASGSALKYAGKVATFVLNETIKLSTEKAFKLTTP